MSTDLVSGLLQLVSRVSGTDPDEISLESRFDELNRWSSLPAMRLLAAVEARFEVRLDLRQYMNLQTVGELVAEITDNTDRTA